MQSYKVLADECTGEITEKKSRFIAVAKPCTTEQEVALFFERVKKQHREAKHNVTAFRLVQNSLARFSDDGEPPKTAGFPVMQAIEAKGLNNCAVVVTRYFGGILLGTGGLVRAYYDAAATALANGTVLTVKSAVIMQCNLEYADYDILTKLFEDFELRVLNVEYGEKIKIEIAVTEQDLPVFLQKVTDTFCSRLQFEQKEKKFMGF